MNERCTGCEVEEKLKNLQALRYIVLTREKRCGAIEKERSTGHDDKTGESIGLGKHQPESTADGKVIKAIRRI
jgi:hypothetical protein